MAQHQQQNHCHYYHYQTAVAAAAEVARGDVMRVEGVHETRQRRKEAEEEAVVLRFLWV